MKKSIYILLILIVSANLLNLRFLPQLKYGSIESLIAILAVICFGLYYYPKDYEFKNEPIVVKYTGYLRFVWLSIGLSVITSFLFWNQSPLQSFVTDRTLFTYLFFFVLITIRPTIDDVVEGFKWFSYIFLIMAFFAWVLHIRLTNVGYNANADIEMLNAIPGTTFLLFYYYYLLTKLSKRFNWETFTLVTAILVYYVLNQNRSILFPCIIFFLYTVFFKAKAGLAVKVFILAVIAALISSYAYMIQGLIEETQAQTNDDSYVRWTAIQYFMYGMSPNIICTIFGNGILSAHSNPELWIMLFSKMWNFNDVGWFGYYAFFGIFGVLSVFNIMFRIIFDKTSPLGIRMMLLHMLVPTIWCFWQPETIILFCLIIYIYIYKKTEYKTIFDE